MLPPLDIFFMDEPGTCLWKGTAENFEGAKLSVKKLMESTPGDYVIFSQDTGNRTTIKADGSVVAANQPMASPRSQTVPTRT